MVKLLTVADAESFAFEGLPDRHSGEAPGRLVPGTDRLTSAVAAGPVVDLCSCRHTLPGWGEGGGEGGKQNE